MAVKDIVPELMDAIRADFSVRLADSPELAAILETIAKKTATFEDGHELAVIRGELLSETLQKIITPSVLPDGRFYFNIANRTVRPMLADNYTAINEAAALIQAELDAQAGIGLRAATPAFAEGRVAGLIDKLSAEDVPIEAALKFLGEPIVNCSEAFFDDYIMTNANARSRAGLAVTLIRTLGASEVRAYRAGRRTRTYRVPCPYCRNLAGSYTFSTAAEASPLFARHENCRCVITYTNAKTGVSTTRSLW